MAYSTVEKIVKASIGDALKLFDNIPDSYIKQAVSFFNASEPFIWRKWPWHNRKVDEITVPPDANGIIVFDGENSDVDMVRAVMAIEAGRDGSILIWNQSDIRAAIDGDIIASGTFQHLSDDAEGNRRIKVDASDSIDSYKVLAFRRFIRAEVNDDYDSENPFLTPNDYRVLTWKLDRAEAPLIAYISDELKKWNGADGDGKWAHGLNGTLKDLREQEATEQVFTPEAGSFGGFNDWY